MRNLLMLLVAVLGTSVMVSAFPAKDVKAGPAKEIKIIKHPKHKSEKKAKSEKKEIAKPEAANAKK